MSVPIPTGWLGYVMAACTVGPLAYTGLISWYKKRRDGDVYRSFVYDMATNHLPHIYDALEKLCVKEGIETNTPPPIQFMTFEEAEKRKNGRH